MSWPYDPSEPIMTAAHALRTERELAGTSVEEQALPPVLIGTFQEAAYAHLLRRTGVVADVDVPDWSVETRSGR